MRFPESTPPGPPIINQKVFHVAQRIWCSIPPAGEEGIAPLELTAMYGSNVNSGIQVLVRAGVLHRSKRGEKKSYVYTRGSARVRIQTRAKNKKIKLVEALIVGVPNLKKMHDALVSAEEALARVFHEYKKLKQTTEEIYHSSEPLFY